MNHYNIPFFFLIFICILFTTSCSTGSRKTGPADTPFYQSGILIEERHEGGFFKTSLYPLYRFYDIFISPIDNRKCMFTPTCSSYSRQSMQKHGFMKGYVLTFARIIRCNPSVFILNRYPHAEKNDTWKAYDPVK
ncbi:MAG TPA: membrane protein insertion efficiency factor YidD [Spirochaetota bacterium]|nr:membrane protein insertion efficiency factor YidD [Spirochaetota bacterium]